MKATVRGGALCAKLASFKVSLSRAALDGCDGTVQGVLDTCMRCDRKAQGVVAGVPLCMEHGKEMTLKLKSLPERQKPISEQEPLDVPGVAGGLFGRNEVRYILFAILAMLVVNRVALSLGGAFGGLLLVIVGGGMLLWAAIYMREGQDRRERKTPHDGPDQ